MNTANGSRRLLAIGLSFFLSGPSFAALAVDSEMPTSAGQGSATVNTLSFSFTNTAGTLLVCGVMAGGISGTVPTINNPTYNSVSMGTPDITKSAHQGNLGGLMAIYHLLTPATGANTFAVTTTGTVPELLAGCISFTGNDTSTPIKQTGSANEGGVSGTALALTLAGVVSGNIPVAFCGGASTLTAENQTLSWLKNVDVGSSLGNGAMTRSASSGSVAFTCTQSPGDWWAFTGVEIAAAAGAAATPTSGTMPLLGM